MKRIIGRSFCHRFAIVAVALFATLSNLHAATDDRPNILWIIVEDASCHIGPYGETAIRTPNLDTLAAQGVTYTAAYVTAPVCSASRSAMITGMNQSTLGVHNHRSQTDSGKGMGSPAYHDSYHLPIRMIPELFKQAGYHTAQNAIGSRGCHPNHEAWCHPSWYSPGSPHEWHTRRLSLADLSHHVSALRCWSWGQCAGPSYPPEPTSTSPLAP